MINKTNKIRLAVFGITSQIWSVLKISLNFYNTKIVGFIDNDKLKHGIHIDNIPIKGKDDFDFDDVDYVVVAALSAYEIIKKSLISIGVCESKIMPFFTEQLCEYDVGSLNKVDYNLLRYIYNDPDKLYELIFDYNNEYKTYCEIKPYEYTGDEWFFKSRFICHACGGKIDNRKYMYTNSKEALDYSLNNGFKLIECDITMRNGVLVAEHDYVYAYEASINCFSAQTFVDILHMIKYYFDVNLLVDVKWKNESEYCAVLEQIEDDILSVSYNDEELAHQLKSQIIMETYNEETIALARNKGFECFFTQYRNPDWTNFYKTVNLCYKYGVNVVGIECSIAQKLSSQLKRFNDKNIYVFSFSTDSVDEYVKLRKNGVMGIFTNYLM